MRHELMLEGVVKLMTAQQLMMMMVVVVSLGLMMVQEMMLILQVIVTERVSLRRRWVTRCVRRWWGRDMVAWA